MVIDAVHVIVIVALHGALRDVADQVGRHGYAILFVLIAAESFAFPLPGEVSLLVGAYETQRGVLACPGSSWSAARRRSPATISPTSWDAPPDAR